MKAKRRLLIYIFLILIVGILLSTTIKNISWEFKGFDNDSPLEIRYSFPNADCVKSVKKQFPFYEFHCKQKDLSSANESSENYDGDKTKEDGEQNQTDKNQ